MRRAASLALLVAGICLGPATCGGLGAELDCGASSLAALAELAASPIPAERLAALAEAMPKASPSMLDLKQAAEREGIPLRGIGVTLEEVAGSGGPAIIHLSDPDHFLVLARVSGEWAQVIDSGVVMGVPRAELEKRYSGHALVLADEPPQDGGRVQVDEFHYGFGISGVGQTIEHTFTVRNAGNRPLMVEADNCKTCGAPDVTVAEELLAPGQSAEVTVKFTVTYAGNVLKAAKLRTDDPRARLVYLTLQGTAPHNVQVVPARLRAFGDKNAVPPPTLAVSGPAEMEITAAACEQGLFEVQVGAPQLDDNGKRTWEPSLALKPRDFVGPIADQLTIHTTHAERPLITVPIAGAVQGDLEVDPPQMFFGFVALGTKAERTVTVRSRSGQAFTLRDAKLGAAGLRVSKPVRMDDGRWQVTVSLVADKPGVVDVPLMLATDVPGEENLRAPAYLHVLPPQ